MGTSGKCIPLNRYPLKKKEKKHALPAAMTRPTAPAAPVTPIIRHATSACTAHNTGGKGGGCSDFKKKCVAAWFCVSETPKVVVVVAFAGRSVTPSARAADALPMLVFVRVC